MRVSEPTFYRWKKNFDGLGVVTVKCLREVKGDFSDVSDSGFGVGMNDVMICCLRLSLQELFQVGQP